MKKQTVFLVLSILISAILVFTIAADHTQYTLTIGNPPYWEWVYRWDAAGDDDSYESAYASTSTVWMVYRDILRYKWNTHVSIASRPSKLNALSEYSLYVEIDGLSRQQSASNVEGHFNRQETMTMLLKPAPHNMPTPDIDICVATAEINGVTADVP